MHYNWSMKIFLYCLYVILKELRGCGWGTCGRSFLSYSLSCVELQQMEIIYRHNEVEWKRNLVAHGDAREEK